MTNVKEVREASARFYAALNRMAQGDTTPMAEAWVASIDASAQHPIGGRHQGYDSVIASFSEVAKIADGGEISLSEQTIVAGSDMAVETGVETGRLNIGGHESTIDQRVTNVYLCADGAWKMVHHHTDVSENLLDILKRISEPA